MKLPEIEWERVRAIIARAEELHQSGQIDRDSWLALVKEFGEVSHGSLEMPGALGRLGQSEWFEELRKTPSQRVA
jgi:hypothetical protein